MSRFQAKTNAVLDLELEHIRKCLGFTPSQKADLLGEVVALASWVIRQAANGNEIAAQHGGHVESLEHPVLERLREQGGLTVTQKINLSDQEVARLAIALNRDFVPTPALRKVLANLAKPKRHPPKITWKTHAA